MELKDQKNEQQLIKYQKQLNEDVQELENEYKFSVSLSQTSEMFEFMIKMSNQCVLCLNNCPDQLTYPSAKESWVLLQNKIIDLNKQVQNELLSLFEGSKRLEVAGNTSQDMLEQLSKHRNPIEILFLFDTSMESIKSITNQVLACFKNIRITQIDTLKELLLGVASQIGTNSLQALQEEKEKLDTKIENKSKELNNLIQNFQQQILEKSNKLAEFEGLVAQFQIKTNQYQILIDSEKSHLYSLDQQIKELNQNSKSNVLDNTKELAEILSKQKHQLDELKYKEDLQIKNLQNLSRSNQERIEETKRKLQQKIANPAQIQQTSRSVSVSSFMGITVGLSCSSSQRMITEDTSQFRSDLYSMQRLGESEFKANIEAQEIQSKAFSKQRQYLMESMNALSQFTMQNNQYTQRLIEQQIGSMQRQRDLAKGSLQNYTEYHSQSERELNKNLQFCSTARQQLNEVQQRYQSEVQTINQKIKNLTVKLEQKERQEEQILLQAGFHSIKSLMQNVRQIELLRQGINTRAHFVIYQIGMITAFDEALKLADSDIKQAPQQLQKINLEADSYLQEMKNRYNQKKQLVKHVIIDYPQEEYQKRINTIFKQNEAARNFFLQDEYMIEVFVSIAELEIQKNEKLWDEFKISSVSDKIKARKYAVEIKKYLDCQEINTEVEEHNEKISKDFSIQDDWKVQKEQKIIELSSDFNIHFLKSVTRMCEFINKLKSTIQKAERQKDEEK